MIRLLFLLQENKRKHEIIHENILTKCGINVTINTRKHLLINVIVKQKRRQHSASRNAEISRDNNIN